ncbi:uncharacterized protein RHO25_010246 [Cercospora beticola]|uniref:DUF3533 domain-containing protein n=1 Tax=Cercospora beticola TaxID=122368 RepID=A0ABZ0P1G1_CERBT|nr:hypothetical protein RHO25_010246 [Cercospora beticola]CAK1365425.1 unnamed protein product [Cercospora beticola]
MASESRIPFRTAALAAKRKIFIKAALVSAIIYLLGTIASMSYLCGSTIKDENRWHNLDILAVHQDSGNISSALESAYQDLRKDSFPTIIKRSPEEYVTIAEHFSREFAYLSFIYNGTRWPEAAEILIASAKDIMDAAQTAYEAEMLHSARRSNITIVATSPFHGSKLKMEPIAATRLVSDVYITTVNFVFPVLLQLFLIITLNTLCQNFQLHAHVRILDVWMIRFLIGKCFTLLSAFVIAGYIITFRDNWDVSPAAGFFRTAAIYWLLLDVNWLFFETLLGSYVDMRWLSPFIFAWLVFNIASTAQPMELIPAFSSRGLRRSQP